MCLDGKARWTWADGVVNPLVPDGRGVMKVHQNVLSIYNVVSK